MTMRRLPAGGLIDRSKTLGFQFDGQSLTGHPGDTLASALLANGQWLMARSFKYHRPRSVLTADASEPNALVTVGTGSRTEPNVRATTLRLHDGLIARSQNHWPSLRFDIGQINSLLSPMLSAGFYYKTFMWPASFWEKVYEPLIRRAAGLGRATTLPDPDHYQTSWAHTDLLIIGAGPAGLSAALTAARDGVRVMLLDERASAGGCALSEPEHSGWINDALRELGKLPNVRILTDTTVFGWYDSGMFGAVENIGKHDPQADPERPVERLWRIRARLALMATGSHERPLVFNGNDRPGILLAGALQTYVNQFAVNPGEAIAIATNHDDAYRCAASCAAAGLPVTAIIDRRAEPGAAALALARQFAIRVIADAQITATYGRQRLSAIQVSGSHGQERLAVDTLGVSGGFNPVVHLSCQRGARPVWDEQALTFAAPPDTDGLLACGAAAGAATTEQCIRHGEDLARVCLQRLGRGTGSTVPQRPAPTTVTAPGWLPGGKPAKAFVDFQNDVTAADLEQAVREGYGHVELAKRYTTAGMATDQGKTGNINMIGLLARARGITPAQIGTTTYRPFYTPVSFGALAGLHQAHAFQARRVSPLHHWARQAGAVFVPAGLWDRSAYFPRPGETHWRETVNREVNTVRQAVGVCDVSTLGKIELTGPDCAEFLNRVYCNKFLKLPVGKARYGIMLREDGFILDDGTTSRLGENHFLMTTTTGAAGQVMTHLEWCHQVLWPELNLNFASVTEQWAQLAIAGPRSRELLQKLISDDLGDEAFPFLAARKVTLAGSSMPARLFRISFSGELAYELAVPADHGSPVAAHLMQIGKPFGICAYGTEAMGVMRIEKGFVTHAEIDGRVTPDDLGMGQLAGRDKVYLGSALLRRDALQSHDRLQLVGLQAVEPGAEFSAGAHLLNEGESPSMENDQGHVSSSCYSPSINNTIALALLRRGRSRHGETIIVWDALRSREVRAKVGPPEHLHTDPDAGEPGKQANDSMGSAHYSGCGEGPLQTWFASRVDKNGQNPQVSVGLCAPGRIELVCGACPENPDNRWLAPTQYLCLADSGSGAHDSIDLSQARSRVIINGPAAVDMLARLCAIDFENLVVGRAAPSLFDDIPALLTRLGDADYEVIVARSFAVSLMERLAAAGRENDIRFDSSAA